MCKGSPQRFPIYHLARKFYNSGRCCKTAGWGVIGNNVTYVSKTSDQAAELQEVGLAVVDLETCAKNYGKKYDTPKVTHDTFCAGTYGRDTCSVSFKDMWQVGHYSLLESDQSKNAYF